MPVCPRCHTDHDVEDLVRHERPGILLVHCPACECVMGSYRRHGDRPKVDTLRNA